MSVEDKERALEYISECLDRSAVGDYIVVEGDKETDEITALVMYNVCKYEMSRLDLTTK